MSEIKYYIHLESADGLALVTERPANWENWWNRIARPLKGQTVDLRPGEFEDDFPLTHWRIYAIDGIRYGNDERGNKTVTCLYREVV